MPSANRNDESPVNNLRLAIQLWSASFAVCAAVVIVSFFHFDLPIASYSSGLFHKQMAFGQELTSAILLSLEAVVLIILVLVRLTRGKLPSSAEVLAIACVASLCAYSIDSNVLKSFFGVPRPDDVLLGGVPHVFHFWNGAPENSFPSGHMVIVSAFAGAFMRFYRNSIWPLSIFLIVVAVLLVAGGWHFLSDVIAGTFVGVSAGLLAGELWILHSSRGTTPPDLDTI